MGNQREKEVKQRKPRGPRWALWETLLACHVVITIRNKFAQDIPGPDLIREYNRLYSELTDEWDKLDHYGLPDRRVSVVVSKEHRISAVDSNTRKTPILRRFEDMVCKVRNELLPILDKKLLVDGKIPSGRQAQECIEDLRVLYKQLVDKDGSIVIKSNTRLSHNVFLPIGQTEPLQELLIEFVQSRKANAKLL